MRDHYFLLSFCVSAGVCGAAIYWMLKTGWQWAIDVPGERSLHARPVLRTGGLGLIGAVVLSGVVVNAAGGQWPWLETVLAGCLCVISLIDDKRGLPVGLRLSAHVTVASIYVGVLFASGRGAGADLPTLIWLPMAVFTIVAMCNFYNFMDGANGIAGGMTLIGFGAFAAIAGLAHPGLTALCCALVGGALGFLPFNWPGRIFMGDSGSVPLGFLAAAAGLSGWLDHAWSFWLPALVFAPFIVDAGVTLLRRMLRGERLSQAHREHYYQRVVRMQASHGRLALGEYILMLLCATGALAVSRLGTVGQVLIIALTAMVFAALMLRIDGLWRRQSAQERS